MRMEEGASGIYTEMTEIDVILEEICEMSYLQEKFNQEVALRREEINLKKQEEGTISLLSQQQLKMQQEMLQMIQQHQQGQ